MCPPRVPIRSLLSLFLLCIPAVSARAQVCNDPGAYCEGWSRDSTRREVSLTRRTFCTLGDFSTCGIQAACSTAPTTALPSIRIGDLNHVVLAFSVPDACVPECPGAFAEPCWNLGVSYRRLLSSGSETVTGIFDCDPSDTGTVVSSGATFSGTYVGGGTDNITVSNIAYGNAPIPADNCGAQPVSLDLVGSGPNLAVQSRFKFTWNAFGEVAAYTEARTYYTLPPPNTVNITVSNINYGAGTYTASVPDASTAARGPTWGQLKLRYR